jgi:hypothetical protein
MKFKFVKWRVVDYKGKNINIFKKVVRLVTISVTLTGGFEDARGVHELKLGWQWYRCVLGLSDEM